MCMCSCATKQQIFPLVHFLNLNSKFSIYTSISTTAVIKERIWKIETLIAMKPYFLFCGFLFSRTSDSFVNGLIVYIRSSNSYQFLLAILIAENIINAPRLSIFRAPRDITLKHQVTLVCLDTRTDSTIL